MALFAANCKEAGKEPATPVTGWMEVSTVKKYCTVWKQVLCYIFRSQNLDEATVRPAYHLTGHQAKAIL